MGAASRLKGGLRRSLARAAERAEVVDIETESGFRLRASVREPPWRTTRRGTAILVHALGGSRADFDKADFAKTLAHAGWRTIAVDLRGHGASDDSDAGERMEASLRYDTLVREDLPTLVASAGSRNRPRGAPLVVIGHSLGGHAAIASQAVGALGADAVVSIAGVPWMRELEPSAVRWAVKRTATRVMDEMMDRLGDMPLKTARFGAGDEAAAYFGHLSKAARDADWRSDDGRDDYFGSLKFLTCPVLVVASKGDRLACHVDCASALVKKCGAQARLATVEKGGHRALVTGTPASEVAHLIAEWLPS